MCGLAASWQGSKQLPGISVVVGCVWGGCSSSTAGEEARGEASLLGGVLCSSLHLSFFKHEVTLTLSFRCFEVSAQ